MTDAQSGLSLFDTAKPEHVEALHRLERELTVWFVTVSSTCEPHGVPVFFLWHEGTVLVLSEPSSLKVKHVRRGSPALVHLDGGPLGEDVVVLRGAAHVSDQDATAWLPEIGERFGAKYAERLEAFEMSVEDYASKFSAVSVVTPAKLTAW